jgi:hypothetical protein
MKGQIFILILLALFLIRINTYTFEILEDELFYESFNNLKNELINTIDISLVNQEDLSTNLNDFITFSKDALKQRGFIESVNYSISVNGNERTINMNISLKSEKSEILNNLIIKRKVYT